MDKQHVILVNGASGRIGRSVTYEMMKLLKESDDYCLDKFKGIVLNDPAGLDAIMDSLGGNDPVHGKFDWKIEKSTTGNNIIISYYDFNAVVAVFAEKKLENIPFSNLGISIVEECSGFYGDDRSGNTKSLSEEFLKYGVERVIQSYPASSDATIIMGANDDIYDPAKHRIISNASCTTKAMAAPIAVMLDKGLDIHNVSMTTTHAATNSQGILKSLNTISTHKTGATKSLAEVFPVLKGKMNGMSYRVPTLDGSFASMEFVLSSSEPLTAEMLNSWFVEYANPRNNKPRNGRIGVFDGKEASTQEDIVGRTENGIVILSKTLVKRLPFDQELTARGEVYATKGVYAVSVVSGYDNERASPVDQALLTQYIMNKR